MQEDRLSGLVIGNDGALFCGGANLDMQAIQARAESMKITPGEVVEQMGSDFQQMMMGVRYAPKPVVAAAFDPALGDNPAPPSSAGSRCPSARPLPPGQSSWTPP